MDLHACVQSGQQLGAGLVAHNGVATIAALAEEVGRRHAAAHRHHHLEARARAGEIHQLELGAGQLGTAVGSGIIQQTLELEHLQPGSEIAVHVDGVDAEAGRRIGKALVHAPLVGNGAGRADHLAQDHGLGLEFGDPVCRRSPHRGQRQQAAHEFIAMLHHAADRVGVQELRIAERRGNRPALPRNGVDAGLHVVGAHAAGFQRVDAHNLVFGQADLEGFDRILALELRLGRALGHEAELCLCGGQEIADGGKLLFL